MDRDERAAETGGMDEGSAPDTGCIASDAGNAVPSSHAARPHRARRIVRRVAIGLAALLVAAAVAFLVYTADYYHADLPFSQLIEQEANSSGAALMTEEHDGYFVVAPDGGEATFGLVLYPGAKVDPAAYAPLACDLAERGVHCIIAKMPFNLAIFGVDAASDLMATAPQVQHWWVGGHSLGGAMASQWAAGHAGDVEGIVLLGAYASSDLSGTDLDALVVYGSEDGVLNRDKLAQNASLLPSGAREVVIAGGNHAGFGAYGSQAGDGEATVSAEEQQSETADAIVRAMGT